MSFTQSMRLALKSILASKARALLTMLGIIIGVGAVIVIVGLGNGMELYMTDQFESMGTNLLTVNIYSGSEIRQISEDEMYQMVADHQDLLSQISPIVNMGVKVKIGTETADSTRVVGVSEDMAELNSETVSKGRFLQYADMYCRQDVCVIGSYLENEFFDGDALGKTVKIDGTGFTVVGVLEESADSTEGSGDDGIYIPYTVAAKMSFSDTAYAYYITCADETRISEAKGLIESTLLNVYLDDDYYMVVSMSELLDMMSEMLDVMVTILAAIAAISLVVGGIGIMNIMLVSVSERTREIGIRKSLGAKQRDIMRQFVIEAATTSAMGGILGIGVGYGLSSLATMLIANLMQEDLKVVPALDAVLGAFAISVAIGIIFGYLPAKKAARLNPIDALHYD